MKENNLAKDNELLLAAKHGDINAESQIIDKYSKLVYKCSRPLYMIGGDVEDLQQEGMLGLLSAIREYDVNSETPFSNFAEVCIKSKLYSAIKMANRKKHFPLNCSTSLDSLLSERPADLTASYLEAFNHSPEDQVIAIERKQELNTFLSKDLTKLEKDVLAYYLDGLSYNDIASKICRDRKAVDNAIQRVRMKLIRTYKLGDIS